MAAFVNIMSNLCQNKPIVNLWEEMVRVFTFAVLRYMLLVERIEIL